MIYEYLMDLAIKTDNQKMILTVWNSVMECGDIKVVLKLNSKYREQFSKVMLEFPMSDAWTPIPKPTPPPHVLLIMILNDMDAK